MSTRSWASVKAQFSAVVDSVHDTHERVVVTRNGEPAVAVIAIDDLESLEETLAVLQNEKVMRDLALDNPQRVGKPLRAPLDGKHSARRGQYRVSYGIDVAENTVTVLAVSHRRHAYS